MLTILPFFLRKYLGRTGALATALFIALSPSFLYFSRFAREDILAATWTLLAVIALVRYLDEQRSFHLYLLAGALSLAFSTKENAAPTGTVSAG